MTILSKPHCQAYDVEILNSLVTSQKKDVVIFFFIMGLPPSDPYKTKCFVSQKLNLETNSDHVHI